MRDTERGTTERQDRDESADPAWRGPDPPPVIRL